MRFACGSVNPLQKRRFKPIQYYQIDQVHKQETTIFGRQPILMQRLFSLLTLLVLIGTNARAQVVAAFTMPDTVCVNTSVNITNTSTNATSFLWNFCSPDPGTPATSVSFGTFGDKLKLSVFMDYVMVNGNYYGFVVNNTPGGLVRLDFGNSLLNTPTAVDLGNFGGELVKSAMGIQVVQNNGRWYAIMVCGDERVSPPTNPRILKIDFGTDITNTTPAVTNWGNIGQLAYAHELYLFQDAALNWFGLTTNVYTKSITRFSFGANFNNPPTATNLVISQLDGPGGFFPVNDNGVWRLFVANQYNSALTRIDFGSSLMNAPQSVVNLGTAGGLINLPRDFIVFASCGESIGYVVNNDGKIVRLAFKDLASAPTATMLPSVAAYAVSYTKIFKQGDDVYTFIPNYIPTDLTRMKFPACGASSLQSSTLQAPPSFTYNAPGKYTVSLRVNEGLPTETSFCKQIVVVQQNPVTAPADVAVCLGDSVQLTATGGTPGKFEWTPATGLSNPFIANPRAGPVVNTQYVVTSGNPGCVAKDTVVVTVVSNSTTSFAISPTSASICPGEAVALTASGGTNYQWLNNANGTSPSLSVSPTATTQYSVRIENNLANCSVADTLYSIVTIKPAPSVKAIKSGDINCVIPQIQLQASGAAQYQWSPATGLSSTTTDKPLVAITQTTQYSVVGKAANGCSASDTITVQVIKTGAPVYYIPNSFTPNNDGLNDCFGFKSWVGITKFKFQIYHRYGGVIFTSTDVAKCWNGTLKGTPMPAGTYVYSLKATTLCGEIERFGTIALIR